MKKMTKYTRFIVSMDMEIILVNSGLNLWRVNYDRK